MISYKNDVIISSATQLGYTNCRFCRHGKRDLHQTTLQNQFWSQHIENYACAITEEHLCTETARSCLEQASASRFITVEVCTVKM